MFCSNCGTQNQDGMKFCSSCGAQLPVAPAPVEATTVLGANAPAPVAPVQPVAPAPVAPAQPVAPAPTYAAPPAPAPKKKANVGLFVGIGVAVVAVIVAIVLVIVLGGKGKDDADKDDGETKAQVEENVDAGKEDADKNNEPTPAPTTKGVKELYAIALNAIETGDATEVCKYTLFNNPNIMAYMKNEAESYGETVSEQEILDMLNEDYISDVEDLNESIEGFATKEEYEYFVASEVIQNKDGIYDESDIAYMQEELDELSDEMATYGAVVDDIAYIEVEYYDADGNYMTYADISLIKADGVWYIVEIY